MIVIFSNLIDILFTRAKHLNDFVISLQVEVWGHDTSLNPELCILVPVSSQESERSPICLRGVDIVFVSMICLLHLELVFFFILLLQQLQPLIDSVCPCLSSRYFWVV